MPDAVVIPGKRFGPVAGPLLYASEVAARRGARVRRHTWSQEPPAEIAAPIEDWVRGEVAAALDGIGGRPLLIGESLGTLGAGVAAERALPAVWLTPLLTLPWAAEALGRASAPFLLVGGTADTWWDGALARRLTPHVWEAEGADHGMFVPGPLTHSIAVLAGMARAIHGFLDAIDWPGRAAR